MRLIKNQALGVKYKMKVVILAGGDRGREPEAFKNFPFRG